MNNQPENNLDYNLVQPSRKKWYKRWWGILIILIISFFLVIATVSFFYVFSIVKKLRSGEITPEELFNRSARQGNIVVPRDTDLTFILPDPYLGPVNAQVVVEGFSDFQCPFCQESAPIIKKLAQEYKDSVKFVFYDFPLTDIHPNALKAALAGQCAHEQGQFWQMHDKIFANQDNLEVADLKRYAIELGLDSIQFGQCLDSNKYFTSVERDFQLGVQKGVRGTPTFFVNGVQLSGLASEAALTSLIEAELRK